MQRQGLNNFAVVLGIFVVHVVKETGDTNKSVGLIPPVFVPAGVSDKTANEVSTTGIAARVNCELAARPIFVIDEELDEARL
jgi:hypothetical protein